LANRWASRRSGDAASAIGHDRSSTTGGFRIGYLRDVMVRLPTQLNSRIEELLPHRWMSSSV